MTSAATTTTTCTEEELKKEAEELTRIALRHRVAINQIRSLFSQARSRGLIESEMHLKYQMGRRDNNTGLPIISKVFGDSLLSTLSRCQKQGLLTVLKWAVMLYEYEKMIRSSGSSGGNIDNSSNTTASFGSGTSGSSYKPRALGADLEERIRQVIRQKTSTWGFGGTNVEQEGEGKITVRVRLSKFYGDPKVLSDDLRAALRSEIGEIGGSNTFLKVWIEKERR